MHAARLAMRRSKPRAVRSSNGNAFTRLLAGSRHRTSGASVLTVISPPVAFPHDLIVQRLERVDVNLRERWKWLNRDAQNRELDAGANEERGLLYPLSRLWSRASAPLRDRRVGGPAPDRSSYGSSASFSERTAVGSGCRSSQRDYWDAHHIPFSEGGVSQCRTLTAHDCAETDSEAHAFDERRTSRIDLAEGRSRAHLVGLVGRLHRGAGRWPVAR